VNEQWNTADIIPGVLLAGFHALIDQFGQKLIGPDE
jgi:hypothetical protein